MARRGKGRYGFKKSAQYGWATQVATSEIIADNIVESHLLVAGDSDIETRAIGGTHCNLKRIIGELNFAPMFESVAETFVADPTSVVQQIWWAILIVDNDDDADQYVPNSPTVLAEERILAHGCCMWWYHHLNFLDFTDTVGNAYGGNTHVRIDVKSNRRLRSDDDVILNILSEGIWKNGQSETAVYNASFRSLLKFP